MALAREGTVESDGPITLCGFQHELYSILGFALYTELLLMQIKEMGYLLFLTLGLFILLIGI